MVIAIIILSILLAAAGLVILVLITLCKRLLGQMIDIYNIQEEIAFLQGEIDIPEEDIAQKFRNATIIYNVEKDTLSTGVQKIVDISNYEKNHLIGLTYLVQPQMFDELKAEISSDAVQEEVRRRILEEEDIDENDLDFLNDLIKDAVDEEFGAEGEIMARPLLPNCTVYLLKDGRWLWRQESY